jgi:hypothetical protein
MILDGFTVIGMVVVLGIVGVLVYFCSRDGCGNRRSF